MPVTYVYRLIQPPHGQLKFITVGLKTPVVHKKKFICTYIQICKCYFQKRRLAPFIFLNSPCKKSIVKLHELLFPNSDLSSSNIFCFLTLRDWLLKTNLLDWRPKMVMKISYFYNRFTMLNYKTKNYTFLLNVAIFWRSGYVLMFQIRNICGLGNRPLSAKSIWLYKTIWQRLLWFASQLGYQACILHAKITTTFDK